MDIIRRGKRKYFCMWWRERLQQSVVQNENSRYNNDCNSHHKYFPVLWQHQWSPSDVIGIINIIKHSRSFNVQTNAQLQPVSKCHFYFIFCLFFNVHSNCTEKYYNIISFAFEANVLQHEPVIMTNKPAFFIYFNFPLYFVRVFNKLPETQ